MKGFLSSKSGIAHFQAASGADLQTDSVFSEVLILDERPSTLDPGYVGKCNAELLPRKVSRTRTKTRTRRGRTTQGGKAK